MTTYSLTGASLARLADALLIPPFPGLSAPPWVLAALGEGLTGVTIFGPNIESEAQLGALLGELRAAAKEPLIAIDEEGGDVTRIAHLSGSPYPGNAALGAVDDPALTESVYRALGQDLAKLGVNLDLAPSVDVNTAADNPVIGTRSFGADTALVARHAAAAVAGLQSAGVAACAKHFPGHGSTSNDSHHVIAAVEGSMEVVAQRDLPPFIAAIKAGVRAIMPGHLRVPGLTGDLPASLSASALTGLLRGELGFTGVIVSDALEMRAVSGPHGIAQAAVLAVAAGTDLLCFGRDQDEATYLEVRDALVEAVRSGQLPVARLEESAARVAELRAWAAAAREARAAVSGAAGAAGADRISATAGQVGAAVRAGTVGGATSFGLAATHLGLVAARRAIKLVGTPPALTNPLLVEIVPPANIAVGAVPWGLSTWVPAESVRRIATTASSAAASAEAEAALTAEVRELLAEAAGRSLIVVVRDAHRYPAAQKIVSELLASRSDAVIVEMGLPVWHPPAQVYLATFGATSASSLAAAQLLGLSTEGSSCGPDRS